MNQCCMRYMISISRLVICDLNKFNYTCIVLEENENNLYCDGFAVCFFLKLLFDSLICDINSQYQADLTIFCSLFVEIALASRSVCILSEMSIRYRSPAGIISDESRPIQTYVSRYIPTYALSNLKWW